MSIRAFNDEKLKAYLKGHADGRAEAEKRLSDIWPALELALQYARDLEPVNGEGNYFAWRYLMSELEAIAAKKPARGSSRKRLPPDIEFMTHKR